MTTKLESGEEKMQKICSMLRKETLEPAEAESRQIIQDAEARAKEIVAEAEKHAKHFLDEAKKQIDRERNVFDSSLSQAAKQSLEALRQEIEQKIFNKELAKIVENGSSKPDIIAKLTEAVIEAISRQGLSADLSTAIPAKVSSEEVNRQLATSVLEKLAEKSVINLDFTGGIKVLLHDKKMTIDISDSALKELLANYIRKDFRKIVFNC